ncbi:MAG: RND family transporter [Pirellulaceae bacterium]
MSGRRARFNLILVYIVASLPLIGWGAGAVLGTNVNSPLDWVSDRFAPRRAFAEFCDRFGSADVVVVSWEGCTLADRRLDWLTATLRSNQRFQNRDGKSYFDRVTSARELLEKIKGPPTNLSDEQARERLRGILTGEHDTACAIIHFTPEGVSRRAELVGLIRSALHDGQDIPPDDIHLAGPVLDGLSVDEASQRALGKYAVPSAVVTFLVCWWCLRSLRMALIVFSLSVYCQALTLALIHYCGATMSALLIVLPPLIQVLTVSGAIHFSSYFLAIARDIPTGAGKPPLPMDLAEKVLAAGGLPCLLSAATTVIGLVSLTVSELTPISQFGGFAAAGLTASTALALFVLPPALAIWIPPESVQAAGIWHSAGRVWNWLAAWQQRYHLATLSMAVIGMVAAGVGLRWLETSVRIETLFAPQSRILRDYAWLETRIGPLVPIEVVVSFDQDCSLSMAERVGVVGRLQDELHAMDGVGATMSAVSFLPAMDRWPAGLPSEMRAAWLDQALWTSLAHLREVHYLNESGGTQHWRVTAHVSALAKVDYGVVLDNVRRRLDPLLYSAEGERLVGVSAAYTGIMPLVHEVQRQLMDDLLRSFLAAFVVITLVLIVAEAGLRAGLIAMVSNLFPALLVFGACGWCRMTVDIGTVMTASIALGIAIDDTLHFLSYFRKCLRPGAPRAAAVRETYLHCGAPMVQSSITCAAGLLVFAFADFEPTRKFAWLMAIQLLIALLGDLLVLPALLLSPFGAVFQAALPETDSAAYATGQPGGKAWQTGARDEPHVHGGRRLQQSSEPPTHPLPADDGPRIHSCPGSRQPSIPGLDAL